METITLDKAIKTALAFAEDSFSRGLLFDTFPDDSFDDSNGDPETLDTIVSMVVGNDVPVEGDQTTNENAIHCALFEKYPYLPSPPERLTLEAITEDTEEADAADLLNFILDNPTVISNDDILSLLRERNLQRIKGY